MRKLPRLRIFQFQPSCDLNTQFVTNIGIERSWVAGKAKLQSGCFSTQSFIAARTAFTMSKSWSTTLLTTYGLKQDYGSELMDNDSVVDVIIAGKFMKFVFTMPKRVNGLLLRNGKLFIES